MKNCWIVKDCLHDETICVCETKHDASAKALEYWRKIAEINGWGEEEITEGENDLYNSSFENSDTFGIEDIVYCMCVKYFPNSLAL